MSGIKGMSWEKEKKKNEKVNSNIPVVIFSKLSKYAKEKKWSISGTIRNIIEMFFDNK